MPYAQCISASLRGETTFVSPYVALALILEPTFGAPNRTGDRRLLKNHVFTQQNNSYGQKNDLIKFLRMPSLA
jgi:hypothetical protein